MIFVAATQNENKIKEIEAITEPFGINVVSRSEAGVPDFEIEEDGDTFEENSLKKARVIMEYTMKASIADDSGLEVDALDGAPGVYSARFAGVDGDDADEENNKKLLMLLKDVPKEKRTARFVSVITIVYPEGSSVSARGECEGYIDYKASGTGGFGYDPLFIPKGQTKSFAELTAEEKNRISHRGNALQKLKEVLQSK